MTTCQGVRMSRPEFRPVKCTWCKKLMKVVFGATYPHKVEGWSCDCGNSAKAVVRDGIWEPEQEDDACSG